MFPGMSVSPFVRPGLGVCPGLFAHLTDFVQLLIHTVCCQQLVVTRNREKLPGHADKKSIPIPHSPHPVAAAGCAIQL